ncbi:MAG: dTDP-4-dehydrorhamnose reductase [Pseudomonadota bacterium]
MSNALRILVVGADGQLGSEFASAPDYLDAELLRLNRTALDITDAQAVRMAVADVNPTAIVNAAAYTAVDRAEAEVDVAYNVNQLGAKNLAIACRDCGVYLIHPSTDYVFDGCKDGAYSETDSTHPMGVYGASKLAGENEIRKLLPEHLILRVSWVFGAYGNNFVKTMLRVGAERDTLGVVMDQIGAPTSAASIARACWAIVKRIQKGGAPVSGTFHYSGAPTVSWFEFAQEIFYQAVQKGLLDRAPRVNAITTAEFPMEAPRPANSQLDSARFEREFGVPPSSWKVELSAVLDALVASTSRVADLPQ